VVELENIKKKEKEMIELNLKVLM